MVSTTLPEPARIFDLGLLSALYEDRVVPFKRGTVVFAHSSASSHASIRLRLLSLTIWRVVDI